MFSDISKFWKNTNGCVEQYICATALYSMVDSYYIIIYRDVLA